jgi:NOL1/NOP2/fmu family ribosome biogenesis protein
MNRQQRRKLKTKRKSSNLNDWANRVSNNISRGKELEIRHKENVLLKQIDDEAIKDAERIAHLEEKLGDTEKARIQFEKEKAIQLKLKNKKNNKYGQKE